MAKLMLTRNILKQFHKYPVKVQKRLAEFIDAFQKDPTDGGLRLHSVKEGMRDPKVHGAELPGGYRAIVIAPEKGDTYLLVHVDKHDDAYQWARNKQFQVHPHTGMFQVFDVEEIQAATPSDRKRKRPVPANYDLNRFDDEELFRAGVPHALIPAVKAICSDEELDSLSPYLPPDARDILYGLASGMNLDEALNEMLGLTEEERGTTLEPDDFTGIADRPQYDVVFIQDEEELREILSAPLDEWRIFLHPCQRKLVQWETKGPMNITGSAGTGKTVALMHRAVHLARKYQPEKHSLLITTFTTTLSITIKHLIRQMAPDVASSIEVTHLHALARTICRRAGWKGSMASSEDVRSIWEREIWPNADVEDLPLSPNEVEKEFELVIDPAGITKEEEYLTLVRSGRPRLRRPDRRKLWPLFLQLQRTLKRRNQHTYEGIVHEARQVIESGKGPSYDHVLVDEVQDFSLEALRLIRALCVLEEGHHDPLCTVGDGHQRIYGYRFPLSRAGIDIRGRSRRLKVNYRTSEEIRRYAQGFLEGVDIDDLDGGTTKTLGDHSAFHGPDPRVVRVADETEEAEKITEWAKELMEVHDLKSCQICVTPYKKVIDQSLNAAGIPVYQLVAGETDPGESQPGIRTGSMKRIKGLEYRAIAMACVDPGDPMNQLGEAQVWDRCERYVAATRAREFLFVSLYEKDQNEVV